LKQLLYDELWRNWFFKGQRIYSNIHLFKIPYYFISGVNQLDEIKGEEERGVYIGLDELWLLSDSRMSRTRKNIFVANVLARSRKRCITYVSTAQVADSIESRIRKVLDFTFYPMMNRQETVIKCLIFRTGYVKPQHYMKTMYFKTPLMYRAFDTNEEVNTEEESKEKLTPCFQESFNRKHGYCCECDECKTRFFQTYEDAEKVASAYYQKNIDKIKAMI
jgi:hypothetical protein